MHIPRNFWPIVALSLAVAGCGGGDFSGQDGSQQSANSVSPDGTGNAGSQTCEATGNATPANFASTVQPHLDFCRTCHVPGGVGDVADGKRFMLSSNAGQDAAMLRASWEALGGNNPTSRILLMASGQESHSGGVQWPKDSVAYKNVSALFASYEGLQASSGGNNCVSDNDAANSEDSGQQLTSDLLGSRRGGWYLADFCANNGSPRPDSTVLPSDPRALVQPGISKDKNVLFNTYWRDCHADAEQVGMRPTVQTCGDLRAAINRGRALMMGPAETQAQYLDDKKYVGTLFHGQHSENFFDGAVFDASTYRSLYRAWGYFAQPNNFDELAAQRYGASFDENHLNPYPKSDAEQAALGKADNQAGTGRLPIYFTQLRNMDGQWTGKIGITCHGCHSQAVGSKTDGPDLGMQYGGSSSLHDYNLFLRDMAVASVSNADPYAASAAMLANLNRIRGTSNASATNLAFFLREIGDYVETSPVDFLSHITSGSTASVDTPAFWNLGSRPAKFVDGMLPTDSARVDLVFYIPLQGLLTKEFGEAEQKRARDWIKNNAQDANDYVATLKSPRWPNTLPAIDENLAKQGSILFHSKDLWAANLKNSVPRPVGGNGSCASCHGAYAPRFVNDPNYLADPSMEGVAAYVTPINIIKTDAKRLDAINNGVQEAGSQHFFGYPETEKDTDPANDCGLLGRDKVMKAEGRAKGYLAPPLYGVWASAPYFHNGSVPNLWEVLKSSDRKSFWRRASTPVPADQQLPPAKVPGLFGNVVMGYDTNIQRAFDGRKVGWKYDTLSCDPFSTNGQLIPLLHCLPIEGFEESPVQSLLSALYGVNPVLWNLLYPPLFTDTQIEGRKIYNTKTYSHGNGGHTFSDVLTDKEREAIIEYLKTL